jgi:DNA-binding MurR/RpiR family transcriptional regulator
MSCLAIISAARDEMSANEKKLANFILDNAPLVRDYSSQQIAASVGISQSSVVKFSQKLGYKGFTDLKLAIHESVVKQESGVAVLQARRGGRGSGSSLKERLYDIKCDAITAVTELNDDIVLRSAARAIDRALRVQVAGVGPNLAIARDFAFRLASTGKPVLAEADAEAQLACARTLGADDCLVIVSMTGQSSQLHQLAKLAKKARVTVISVTDQAANPISAVADVRLYSVSPARKDELPDVLATTSRQHVMDLVFYTLARQSELESGAAQDTIPPVGIKKAT